MNRPDSGEIAMADLSHGSNQVGMAKHYKNAEFSRFKYCGEIEE
jgi:hypothetical protein